MIYYIGWVIVAWLTGSTIYSTAFHLGNYLKTKNKNKVTAKDLDFPGQEVLMNKKDFLKRVLSIQIIKTILIMVLVYLLLFK